MRCLLILPLILMAACETDSSESVAGTWKLTRTLGPVPEGCDPIKAGGFEVTITPGAEKPFDCLECFDNGNDRIDGTHVQFVTAEFAFEGNSDMVIIGHDLELVDGKLVGTAGGGGDGANIGCEWRLDVVGERVE